MTIAETVSVALCTHNGEQFVERQLSSILGQSVTPDELIVSDDASGDKTVAIVTRTLTRWQSEHPERSLRTSVLRNPTAMGIAANFAQAISACGGDLIVLSDQDDIWHANRIERMLAAFSADPALLLLHGDADLVDSNGSRLAQSLFEALEVTPAVQERVHSGHAFEILLRRNVVTGAVTSFRRELAQRALPVPEGWLHDEWLAMVASATGRVDLTAERLIDYRQHDQNQVGARKLSVVGKFGRMVEPGSERSARLLVRAGSLVDRIADISDVPAERRAAVADKLEHERVRSALRRHRAARVWPILRELATGRYGTYGRGVLDGVRDLLQPLPRVDG